MKDSKPEYSVPQLSDEMDYEQGIRKHEHDEGVSFDQTVEAEKFFMSSHERKEKEYAEKFSNKAASLKGE